jgi:hypothetical protein
MICLRLFKLFVDAIEFIGRSLVVWAAWHFAVIYDLITCVLLFIDMNENEWYKLGKRGKHLLVHIDHIHLFFTIATLNWNPFALGSIQGYWTFPMSW